METIMYRKREAYPRLQELHTSEHMSSTASTPDAVRDTGPLSLDLFFPVVTEEEMITWTHWLPTCIVFDCASVHAPADVISTLTQLKAPPEVLEEFHWSWKLGLFEAYEIRTPVRTDARDPLLLGRVGEQRYRLALWGESLLPLEHYRAGATESGAEDTGGKTQGMDGSQWGTLGACHRVIVGVALTSDPTFRHKFLVCLCRLFFWPGSQRSSIRRRIASTIFSIAIVASAASSELSRGAARVLQPVTCVTGCPWRCRSLTLYPIHSALSS